MKIGNRDIIYTTTLLVPKGEEAWIDFNVGAWEIKLNIVFEDSSEKKGKPFITIEAEKDYGRIIFKDWTDGLGTASTEPMEIARTNEGRAITFLTALKQIGSVKEVHLQFYLEPPK